MNSLSTVPSHKDACICHNFACRPMKNKVASSQKGEVMLNSRKSDPSATTVHKINDLLY